MDGQIERLGDILDTIMDRSPNDWVYLSKDGGDWTLDTKAATLENEDYPPELENEPDAGVPEFARDNGLAPALTVPLLQDIVVNARLQRPEATLDDLLSAFRYYYDWDGFIQF